MATTDSRATANCAQVTSEAGTSSRRSSVATGSSGRFLLGLVLDEVDLGLAGLSRGRGRDDDVLLLVGLLNQHVHQCLLFVLRQNRDLGRLVGRSGRRLDEDDLVVLLGGGYRDRALGTDLLRLWWRHVHVDVLLDDGILGTAAGRESAAAEAATAAKAGTAASEAGTAASEAGTAGAERGRTKYYIFAFAAALDGLSLMLAVGTLSFFDNFDLQRRQPKPTSPGTASFWVSSSVGVSCATVPA
uniref:(northern house mosquito) hypothetical protein n=1 Tax=Culex pipiens TaxID=7175 RepID=A0A8D8B2T3_CULPI